MTAVLSSMKNVFTPQSKSGIMVNVDVSVKFWKNAMCAKKIIFRINK